MSRIKFEVTMPERQFMSGTQFFKSIKAPMFSLLYIIGQEIIKKKFESITNTWIHRPKFEVRKIFSKTEIGINLVPTPENDVATWIWIWLDEGTPPHPIEIRDPGPNGDHELLLPDIWRKKTFPGSLISGPGLRIGSRKAGKKVNHPGIAPRKFTEGVSEWLVTTLNIREVLQNKLNDLAKRSGLSMK